MATAVSILPPLNTDVACHDKDKDAMQRVAWASFKHTFHSQESFLDEVARLTCCKTVN